MTLNYPKIDLVGFLLASTRDWIYYALTYILKAVKSMICCLSQQDGVLLKINASTLIYRKTFLF